MDYCCTQADHMLKEATFQLPDPAKVAPMITVPRCSWMIYLVSEQTYSDSFAKYGITFQRSFFRVHNVKT